MVVSLIAAVARNGVIGRDGGLPWHLPDDMAFFRRSTRGKPMIMGRLTFESFDAPLRKRRNVVLSRDPDYRPEGADVVADFDAALALCAAAQTGADSDADPDECMVIGGQAVYEAALPRAQRMYLTRVHADAEGDTYFPDFDAADWREVWREDHPRDERHAHAFSMIILEHRDGVG